MSLQLLIVTLIFTLAAPVALLHADSLDPISATPDSPPAQAGLTSEIYKKITDLDGPNAHLLDAVFMVDVRTKEKALDITARSYDSSLDPGNIRKNIATDLYNAWKTPKGDGTDPQNTQQYLALIAGQAGALDLQSKFLLLSMIGEGLDKCYNAKNAPYTGTPPDRIFASLRAGTKDCGVCRDAHEYMAGIAKQLGFVDVGLTSVLWRQSETDLGSHDLMHMKDPKTGIYYIQNWNNTFSTNQKTLTQAADVVAAVLGQLSGTSLIESKPGVVHNYQPRVTRWVRQSIEDAAKLGGDRSVLTVHVGNREQNFRFELGSENTKVFALHDNYDTSNGPYTIDAVGVAGQIAGKKELPTDWLSEAGYAGNIYLGALRINAPYLSTYNAGNGTSGNSVTEFIGFNVSGYARISSLTAKLELHADMMDFSPVGLQIHSIEFQLPPNQVLKGSLKWARQGSPVSVTATRAWQVGINSTTEQKVEIHTLYDKINLVVDTRNGQNHFYVVNSTGVYLFHDKGDTSAIGVVERLKAAIPTEKLGDFYVVFDASAIVANFAKDPFYEAPLALSIGAGWTKKIYKALTGGIDISASTSQRPYYLFEEPGTVTPELGRTEGPSIVGNVWLGGKF